MITKRIVLKFPPHLVEEPVACKLVKDHNLDFNILKAYVTPREEGLLVLELKGAETDYQHALDYLHSVGVHTEPLHKDIFRDEDKCTQCGACVGICPADALYKDAVTQEVFFDSTKCIACELCIKACPPRAMDVRF